MNVLNVFCDARAAGIRQRIYKPREPENNAFPLVNYYGITLFMYHHFGYSDELYIKTANTSVETYSINIRGLEPAK